MTHWRATDGGMLTLPSGRTIRGRGLSTDPDASPDPEFGLYLLASPMDTSPPWDHTWVEWTDFGLPADPSAAHEALRAAWRRATHERVEVACLGGLGRTGTALACLAVLDGLPADAAITLVRARYDVRAIETPEQLAFVHDFAAAQPEGAPAAPTAGDTDDPVPRAVRVRAYAVCIHDGAILLSHQMSTGAPTIGQVLGVHSNTYLSSDGIERHGIRILFEGTFVDGAPAPASPDDGEIDQVDWFPLSGLPGPITEWAALGVRLSCR